MKIPFKDNCINFYPLNNNFDSLTGIKPNYYSGTFNTSKKCIEFTGPEYIDFPLSALNLPAHNFSIVLQVKLKIYTSGDHGIIWVGSLGSYNPYWSKGVAFEANYQTMTFGVANTLNGGGIPVPDWQSCFNVTDDEFDTIVITDTEKEAKLYINNKLALTVQNPGNTPTSGSIMLGKHDGYWNGLYRNLGSYNIAFTKEQVKQINFKDESNMIKSSVKNTILNNKLFQEYYIPYKEE